MEKIWDIQGFSGGESDDIYRWPKDSFYSAENVEVRKNLSGVQLASKLTDTGWNINGTITCMVSLRSLGVFSGGIIVCTDTGKVYLNGTLMTTFATGTTAHNIVIGIGVMTIATVQYVYFMTRTFFGAGKIHRSDTSLTTFNVSYRSFTTSSGNWWAFVINNNGQLYFAVRNKVIKLDNLETVSDALILQDQEYIRWFTQFQNSYRIYANTSLDNDSSGIQYIWNWSSSSSFDYRQVWENQPVLWVISDGAFDYAILWFSELYSDLYLISGTQKQELRVNLESSTFSRVLNGFLSIRETIVYISGGQSGESTQNWIYTYGNYYPGTSKSLVQSYGTGNWTFLVHTHTSNNSYFADSNSKVWTTDYNNPPFYWYATTGYVVSQIYEGNIWEEKKLTKIKVGFKLSAGDTINIYIRKELGNSWTLAKTINNTNYSGKKHCTITSAELNALNFGTFNTIQMKMEIVSGGTSHAIATCVKRVTTFMEVINLI